MHRWRCGRQNRPDTATARADQHRCPAVTQATRGLILPDRATRQFDWFLGAAIIAAPFYWWLFSILVAPASRPVFADVVSQRFIVIALVYPVLEEIVFRGAIQGWLLKKEWGRRRWSGLSGANVVTSLVFAAAHVVRRPSLLSAGVFIPSLVFGFFRERYNNLYVPIALHIFYNAGVALLFR